MEWTTANEVNNDYFIVERKNEIESEWNEVGKVNATGNSNSIKNYKFVDYQLPISDHHFLYYRLKQTDYNGQFGYSQTVSITTNDTQQPINISLNTAKQQIVCSLILSVNDKVVIDIIDMLGRKIISKTMNLQSGKNQFSIDVSNYPQGIYLIQLITETGKYQTQKKLIVK